MLLVTGFLICPFQRMINGYPDILQASISDCLRYLNPLAVSQQRSDFANCLILDFSFIGEGLCKTPDGCRPCDISSIARYMMQV